ncbi:MAG TPA: hypothetical protein VE646_12500 [Actinomycetota bacterium]|jgi:hypothetical protein|nr:hypothetical protein [Actinomycetota bacterium]
MGTTGSGAVLLSLCITVAVLAVATGMLFVSSLLERLDRPRTSRGTRAWKDGPAARAR